MKTSVVFLLSLVLYAGCASHDISSDPRLPAGTGDIDSSTLKAESLSSYKLPIIRNGVKKTRVAQNFWSGEYPAPVVDVNAKDKNKTTVVEGYRSLRDLSNRVSCTIKNGLYHPWSDSDPSSLDYYSIVNSEDYSVIKETAIVTYPGGSLTKKKALKIPAGAKILNVTYAAENFCSATLQINKKLLPIGESCPFFQENPKHFQLVSEKDPFEEQWLYLKCEEKDSSGVPLKIFVKDTDLINQKSVGVKEGCLNPVEGNYASSSMVQSCQ